MATLKWLGGATAVAQVSTVTLNNDFNDSETAVAITLTAEDGSTTQSVSITPSGTDESTIASALQVACSASNQSLFTAITFTVASNVVTLTANEAGRPFYFASSVTGGAGTTTDATGTANAGPNDWNTDANWGGGSKPTGSDSVVIADGDYSILYGLDQSSVSLTNFSVNVGFAGTVGDPASGYSLQINGNVANIRASNAVWWEGDMPSWTISATGRGTDAVRLKDTTGISLRVLGPACVGQIRIVDGTGASTIFMTECPRAEVYLEDNADASSVRMGAGTFYSLSDVQNFTIWGGTATFDGCGIYDDLSMYGGTVFCDGSPASGNNGGKWFGASGGVVIFGGLLTFANNTESSVTIEQGLQIYGGTVNVRSGLNNITWDNAPTVWGGQLIVDQGSDPTP